MIYVRPPKQKKRKPNAKQRELIASWEEILKKYPSKPKPSKGVKSTYKLEIPRKTTVHPSLNSSSGSCTKPREKIYTGGNIIGIGTLHKSISTPVFSKEEAVEISKMRRG